MLLTLPTPASTQTWLRSDSDRRVRRIDRRVANLTGVPASWEGAARAFSVAGQYNNVKKASLKHSAHPAIFLDKFGKYSCANQYCNSVMRLSRADVAACLRSCDF